MAKWHALTFMGPQMSEWINSKGLDALKPLAKGFIITLLARYDSHLRT